MTETQLRLLNFLKTSIAATGVCPSYEEIRQGLGIKSKSNIHRLIHRLEEQGAIRRANARARAIELVPPRIGAADLTDRIMESIDPTIFLSPDEYRTVRKIVLSHLQRHL